MDLRVIVAYLDRKRLPARAIHNDIVATLRPNIVGYSRATRKLREAKFPLSTEECSDANDQKLIDNPDEVILSALNEIPFACVWQLSRFIHLPPTTVYRRLTQSLELTAHHLRWVPHALSNA
jgi:hypothetical protein